MTAQSLFVCSALVLLFANGAYARGAYQRTKDGETLVWNERPGSGYEATWSGDRDADGYAKGEGTLAWYRVNQPIITGSSIPSTRRVGVALVARYSGNMVRGKLEGPVLREDADGRTLHSAFVDGNRATDWTAGPLPNTAPGGTYQRTKDGETLVWNERPGLGYEATWSGDRDANGYAIGQGTLAWYRVHQPIVTGSNIPSTRRVGVALVTRYSGKMVRGKLAGPVVRVDADGTTFHTAFLDGRSTSAWAVGPERTSVSVPRSKERVQEKALVKAPAQPTPSEPSVPDQQRDESIQEKAVADAPGRPEPTPIPVRRAEPVVEAPTETEDSNAIVDLFKPPSSLRTAVTAAASPRASPPSEASTAGGAAVDNRALDDLKKQTESVLSQVSDATANFHEIDRRDAVQKLPVPVSENIHSLVDRAHDVRAKIEGETALREYRTETEIVGALLVVDEITRDLAANDVSTACLRVADFLKSHPEPPADNQKALWRYLNSARSSCSQSEKDAGAH